MEKRSKFEQSLIIIYYIEMRLSKKIKKKLKINKD